MLRWSFGYPMPTENFYIDEMYSTMFDKKILFISEQDIRSEAKRMDLLQFDTESRTFKEIECSFDGVAPDMIIQLSSRKNNICLWTCQGSPKKSDYMLTMFKLDIDNCVWIRKVEIKLPVSPQHGPAQFGCFWITDDHTGLIIDKNNKTKLFDIDMITNDVEITVMEDRLDLSISWHTMTHHGNLYLVEHVSMCGHRTVYLVENGEKIEILRDEYKVDGKGTKVLKNAFAEGILYKSGRLDQVHLYLDKFDFDTNAWNRTEIESCWHDPLFKKIHAAYEVDGNIYAIANTKSINPYYNDKNEIRVLERNPSHSTRYLYCLVDDLIRNESMNIDIVKNQIPIDLRCKLTNMVEWRLAEMKKLRKIEIRYEKYDCRNKEAEELRRLGPTSEMRWSTSIPFRVQDDGFCGRCARFHCQKVGKNIWFSTANIDTNPRDMMNMMVLDTETEKVTTVKCKYDGSTPYDIITLMSHENIIYMWTLFGEWSATLFQLDINTLEWKKRIDCEISVQPANPEDLEPEPTISTIQTSENQMYLLVELEETVELYAVDLANDIVTRNVLVSDTIVSDWNGGILLTNNGKLYLVQHYNSRVVYLIENGKMIKVAKDGWKDGWMGWSDAKRKIDEGFLYNCGSSTAPNLYYEKFNFETKRWVRTEVDAYWYNSQLAWALKTNDKVYLIVAKGNRTYEFRMLEIKPTFTTRYLFSLVDELIEKESVEIDIVKNKLPIYLREKLSNMIECRLTELEELRKTAINREKRNERTRNWYPRESMKKRYQAAYDCEDPNFGMSSPSSSESTCDPE